MVMGNRGMPLEPASSSSTLSSGSSRRHHCISWSSSPRRHRRHCCTSPPRAIPIAGRSDAGGGRATARGSIALCIFLFVGAQLEQHDLVAASFFYPTTPTSEGVQQEQPGAWPRDANTPHEGAENRRMMASRNWRGEAAHRRVGRSITFSTAMIPDLGPPCFPSCYSSIHDSTALPLCALLH